MKSSSKDRVFVFIILAVVSAASILLYNELNSRLSAEGLREIGTVTYRFKKAERKYKKQVVWKDIDQHEPVYNFDSIRTIEGATAHIQLKDGTSIDIEENTLILLSMEGKKINIGFEQGRISADTSKSSGRDVSVKSKTSSVKMKKGRLSLARKNDSFSVNVSSGSAVIRGKAGVRKVAGGMKATLNNKAFSVEKVDIRPDEPKPGAFFVAGENWHSVLFRWKNTGDTVQLDVSTSPSFQKLLFSRKVEGGIYKRAFVPGIYYWRLRSTEKEKGGSEPSKFTVLRDAPAVMIEPRTSREFVYHATPPEVAIAWKRTGAATSYRVEIAADPGFGKIIKSHETAGTRFAYRPPKKGRYYCRVQSLYSFSGSSFKSVPVFFRVRKTRQYLAPEPVSPAPGAVESVEALSREPMLLGWKKDHEAVSYEVEVSRDKKFKSVFYRNTTARNFDTVNGSLKAGKYYWRVRAVSAGGEKLPLSRISEFSVKASLPITLLEPKAEARFSVDAGKFLFRWSDPNRLGNYRLEFFASPSMKKKLMTRETKNDYIELRELRSGRYFWRVVPGGALAQTGSPLRVMSVSGKLPLPEIIYPHKNSTINVRRMQSLMFSWKPVRGATEYEITLYRYRGFYQTRLLTRTSYSPRFILKDFTVLDIDNFMWEVKAVKKERARVTAASSGAKGYFSISLGEASKPQKIRITSPGIIYVD